ncbi:MAG: PEP-utilizing enzyme [Candidatus Pacebacteria bacterium]|nr:PEP-utilizing enzyme [Candidatus Paceibacterota bacterium]
MKQASGIITEQGSRTCHAAIVGRELQIPTIVACKDALKILKPNQEITISCSEGEIGKVYKGLLTIDVAETEINKKELPVKLSLNIGDPEIAFQNAILPNDGVGLAREEFIIANYIKIHPLALIHYKLLDKETKDKINEITNGQNNETYYINRLANGISKIACAFHPKEVIVRFSDFKTNEYRNLIGGEYFEEVEENPMIGFRGARRYYDKEFKPAFILECKAIKKVIDYYGFKNVSIMIPFCRTPDEARKVLKILEEQGLTKETLKRYIMCELPSNIILADKFLDLFDGMSIGSNDLTQLTLGIDRDNGLLKIDDERNEAVLKQISDIILKCKQRNKYIGICGDAPSTFKDFMKFLVLNKIDSISLSPDAILKTIQELNKFN